MRQLYTCCPDALHSVFILPTPHLFSPCRVKMLRLPGPAGGTQGAQLPLGAQEGDIMDELNRELWFLPVGGTLVMSRGEFLNLKADDAYVVLVEKKYPRVSSEPWANRRRRGRATMGGVAPISPGAKGVREATETPCEKGEKTATRKCECACLYEEALDVCADALQLLAVLCVFRSCRVLAELLKILHCDQVESVVGYISRTFL